MRILLVAKPWRGGLPDYLFNALLSEFPEAVVRWVRTQPEGKLERMAYRRDRSAWRRRLVESLNRTTYDMGLFLGVFPEMKSLESRPGNVLWLQDDPTLRLDCVGAFSKIFISDPGYRDAVEASDAGRQFAGVLPFGYSPAVHKPWPSSPGRRGVCFIGNRDSSRDEVLRDVIRDALPIHIYGNYFLRHRLFWRYPLRFRRHVPIARMAEIYARHQVSLNVHANVVRGGTNMRTFECAGYGIPQVVEWRPGLSELFEPEREILVYRDNHEMIAQLRRVMDDRELARSLSRRARERAQDQHAYAHRIRAICSSLKIG